MKNIILVGVSIFVLSGCAKLNSTLGQINNTLGNVSNSVNTLGSVSSSAGSVIETTSEQDISSLMPVPSDKAQKEQIAEAKPVIQKVLSTLACAKDTKGAVFQKYAIRNRVFEYKPTPIRYMENHASGCTQITRLNNYKYLAKNAFYFEATFESPQSGEVQRRSFEIQKQAEGDWLFSKYNRF